jgi:hypothetical protein
MRLEQFLEVGDAVVFADLVFTAVTGFADPCIVHSWIRAPLVAGTAQAHFRKRLQCSMPVPLVLALKRAFDDLSNRGTHQNIAQKNSAQNGIENRVPQKMPLNRFIADLPR